MIFVNSNGKKKQMTEGKRGTSKKSQMRAESRGEKKEGSVIRREQRQPREEIKREVRKKVIYNNPVREPLRNREQKPRQSLRKQSHKRHPTN